MRGVAPRLRGAALSLALAACAPPRPAAPGPEGGRAEVMAADRAFAAAATARGLDGWMEWMAADAARLPRMGGGAVRGLDEIRRSDAGIFSAPGTRLAWDPTDGGAFSDARHGFTTGRYQLLRKSADGTEAVVGQGAYVTLWRREPDGRWRVLLDTGAADP
jgi:ketosteroid isomerase-like protein